jgi:hypothetical protein
MTHHLHRRGLALVAVAVVVFAAGCGGGSKTASTTVLSAGSEATPVASPSSSAAATTPTVEAVTAGVQVDGTPIEKGSSRPIAVNELIELTGDSRARLRVGELEVMMKSAIARLVAWDPREIALYLEKGVMDSTLESGC